jgi:metal-responsive CopG/Arc/MetJ family transcriptional regulator
MTLEDELVNAVDQAARRLGTTRSAFTREALRDALRQIRVRELERKHALGYARRPVRRRELSGWRSDQAWGDE